MSREAQALWQTIRWRCKPFKGSRFSLLRAAWLQACSTLRGVLHRRGIRQRGSFRRSYPLWWTDYTAVCATTARTREAQLDGRQHVVGRRHTHWAAVLVLALRLYRTSHKHIFISLCMLSFETSSQETASTRSVKYSYARLYRGDKSISILKQAPHTERQRRACQDPGERRGLYFLVLRAASI